MLSKPTQPWPANGSAASPGTAKWHTRATPPRPIPFVPGRKRTGGCLDMPASSSSHHITRLSMDAAQSGPLCDPPPLITTNDPSEERQKNQIEHCVRNLLTTNTPLSNIALHQIASAIATPAVSKSPASRTDDPLVAFNGSSFTISSSNDPHFHHSPDSELFVQQSLGTSQTPPVTSQYWIRDCVNRQPVRDMSVTEVSDISAEDEQLHQIRRSFSGSGKRHSEPAASDPAPSESLVIPDRSLLPWSRPTSSVVRLEEPYAADTPTSGATGTATAVYNPRIRINTPLLDQYKDDEDPGYRIRVLYEQELLEEIESRARGDHSVIDIAYEPLFNFAAANHSATGPHSSRRAVTSNEKPHSVSSSTTIPSGKLDEGYAFALLQATTPSTSVIRMATSRGGISPAEMSQTAEDDELFSAVTASPPFSTHNITPTNKHESKSAPVTTAHPREKLQNALLNFPLIPNEPSNESTRRSLSGSDAPPESANAHLNSILAPGNHDSAIHSHQPPERSSSPTFGEAKMAPLAPNTPSLHRKVGTDLCEAMLMSPTFGQATGGNRSVFDDGRTGKAIAACPLAEIQPFSKRDTPPLSLARTGQDCIVPAKMTNEQVWESTYCYGNHAQHRRKKKRKKLSMRHLITYPKGDVPGYYPCAGPNDTVLDCFHLKMVFERDKTGFQESKEFRTDYDTLIAGRYRILSCIGQAAFSRAFHCLDTRTNSEVCVKMIRNDKDYIDQSLDEIHVLRYLNSNARDIDARRCLLLLDYFYYQEHLFLVTELLGSRLRAKNYRSYFTIGKIQKIAYQVLVALEFIHSLRLIHCDLKPENILCHDEKIPLVKVIDFGSACFEDDKLTSYVQSRSYRAPEIILGLSYDQKIDIWSLGCIIAELWTGFVLFQNEGVTSMLARIAGILGPIPHYMVAHGRAMRDKFTSDGQLFEYLDDVATNIKGRRVRVLLPKKSSLKQRMRIDDGPFLTFLSSLLSIDPCKRKHSTTRGCEPMYTLTDYDDR